MSTPKRGRWQRKPPKLTTRQFAWFHTSAAEYVGVDSEPFEADWMLWWSIPVDPPTPPAPGSSPKPPRKAKR